MAAQVISASYNPSVSGLPGTVGDVVAVAGGASSWVKFGTGVTDWQAFPTTPADVAKLATVPTGAGVHGQIESATLDLLATSSDNVLTGTISGKYFICTSARWMVYTLDGTITTPPTMNSGNDVSKINTGASGQQISAANITSLLAAGGPPAPVSVAAGVNNLNRLLVTAATAFKVDVTVAATPNTATVFTAKLILGGYWTN